MSDRAMTDEEIIQGVLEGCSLRTFMVPDPAMPSNHPEHTESYDLPHVIINGNKFWAKSETAHLMHIVGNDTMGNGAYCYTNQGELYCSYDPQYSVLVALL
jgi:hypothetical protein